MKTLLLGGTDLTLAVANAMSDIGLPIAGLVGVGHSFPISYAAGRVENTRFTDLRVWCESRQIPYLETTKLPEIDVFAKTIEADFCLAAGWYHMLPKWFRDRFSRGVAGFHASLLPNLRGGAPLNWAILLNLPRTGVTLFQLSDGVDDGAIYDQRTLDLTPRQTIGDLADRARELTIEMVRECLPQIASGARQARPQVGKVSYVLQRNPEDGRIDWTRSAEEVDRLVRAVGRPYPGARSRLDGQDIFIWIACAFEDCAVFGAPGQIACIPESEVPCVIAGRGVLAVVEASTERGDNALPLLLKSGNRRFSLVGQVQESAEGF